MTLSELLMGITRTGMDAGYNVNRALEIYEIAQKKQYVREDKKQNKSYLLPPEERPKPVPRKQLDMDAFIITSVYFRKHPAPKEISQVKYPIIKKHY